jgi:hypothetical protein
LNAEYVQVYLGQCVPHRISCAVERRIDLASHV